MKVTGFAREFAKGQSGWKGRSRAEKEGIKGPIQYDYKNKYSLAIAWCGLNLPRRKDPVREADGEAMMTYRKLNWVHFFATKHPKYVILANMLLESINGWIPEKLKITISVTIEM